MKKLFLIILISLFVLTGMNIFAEDNSSITQPEWAPFFTQELLKVYPLPAGPIKENDMPGIKTVIQQVLNEISESIKSADQAKNKADVRPIMLGILIFQDWLRQQGCVKQASNWYVEAIDKYSDHIFRPYPGEVPFDIIFNMGKDVEPKDSLYRLLISVTTVDLLSFASLTKNKKVIAPKGQDVPYLVPSDLPPS